MSRTDSTPQTPLPPAPPDSPVASVSPVPADRSEPAAVAGPGPSLGRLVGVDLARALAVFGMFAVHVGPQPVDQGGVGGWLLGLAQGRSSVLFATLAGFSLVLITGRREPRTGPDGRRARARVVIRAVILLAVGTALTMTSFGTAVILNYYGLYFLLALPLVRLRARTLAITAAGLALVAPQVAFGLRALLNESVVNALTAFDPLQRLSGVGVLDLLLTGFYPAITWMPFVVAGMALGRLDLLAGTVQRRLAGLGAALVVLGYGTSWLVLRWFAGAVQAPFPASTAGPGSVQDPASTAGTWGLGSGPFQVDGWLALGAEPHSGSTFDVVGSLGVAILVLVGATVVTARWSLLRRLAAPVIAVGTMSLTIYVAHVLAIVALPGDDATPPSSASAALLAGFVAGAVLFAVVWSRFFRRGPLEYLLNRATRLAAVVVR